MNVAPGQIWEDLDPRTWNTKYRTRRRIRVVRVDSRYAYCVGVYSGRRTRISLKRMRPIHNGFELLEEPKP